MCAFADDITVIEVLATEEGEEQVMIESLLEICEELHGSGCLGCPVYDIEGEAPDLKESRWGCDCFKSGRKMFNYIHTYYSED